MLIEPINKPFNTIMTRAFGFLSEVVHTLTEEHLQNCCIPLYSGMWKKYTLSVQGSNEIEQKVFHL